MNNFVESAIDCKNVVRQFASPADPVARGIQFVSCDQGVGQNNIFDLGCDDTRLTLDARVGEVAYLNNQRQSGVPARGWDNLGQQRRDDLRTRIEDATLFGI